MIINHNMNAMNAHRNMMGNVRSAGKSMEKLSSGLRINRAGDDAAGLAISEKMRAQVRGLDQASRNAQDGISMIQTAEGALNETHSILQRMRELATQAANDTNNTDDRQQIQKEINQLTSEINRIGNTTEFNTQKMLDGGEAAGKADATKGGDAEQKMQAVVTGSKLDAAALKALTSETKIKIGGTEVKVAGTPGTGYTNINDLKAAVEKGIKDAKVEGVTVGVKDGALTLTAEKDIKIEGADVAKLGLKAETTKAEAVKSEKAGEEAKAASKAFGDLTITAKEAGKAGNDIKVEFKASTGATAVTAAVKDGVITITGKTADLTNDNIKAAIEGNDDAKKLVSVEVATGKGSETQTAASGVALEGGADKSEAEGFTATLQIGANKGQAFKMEIADMRSEALGISQKTSGAAEAGDAGEAKGEAAKAAEKDFTIDGKTVTVTAGAENGEKGNNIEIEFAKANGTTKAAWAGNKLTITLSDNTTNENTDAKINAAIQAATGTVPSGLDASKINVSGLDATATGADLSGVGVTMPAAAKLAGGADAKAAEKADGAEETTGAVFTKTGAVTNGTDDENVESALDVTSHKNATNAIDVLNTAINTVSTERSKLGAYQNRLEHTINNLGTSSENLQAAESRIRDVDMASEMMTFSKNNILQQAAQAMLAQANQQPQGVLQLLR
ncbi:flagellin [Clostridium oceanicum]|uniref:Flagellin n=1 Tax=Clostridium oceanicum TaxID=1543 RepID=A0ABN1JTP7_9CLOT